MRKINRKELSNLEAFVSDNRGMIYDIICKCNIRHGYSDYRVGEYMHWSEEMTRDIVDGTINTYTDRDIYACLCGFISELILRDSNEMNGQEIDTIHKLEGLVEKCFM